MKARLLGILLDMTLWLLERLYKEFLEKPKDTVAGAAIIPSRVIEKFDDKYMRLKAWGERMVDVYNAYKAGTLDYNGALAVVEDIEKLYPDLSRMSEGWPC